MDLQKTILVDAIGAFVIEDEGIYAPLHEMLDSFPNRKVILTNADDSQMRTFGLDSMPYEVFTLKHNPNKSSHEYYRSMLLHFGFSVSDVIYFEHDIDAVRSAQSVGINTFHYDENRRNVEELRGFLSRYA